MEFKIDVHGDTQIKRELLTKGKRPGNAKKLWPSIFHLLESREKRQFSTQGKYASGGWAPLAPSTKARKAAMGLDPRILHATHALRDSLIGKTKDSVRKSKRSSMEYGTSLPYGGIHQHGGAHIPQRRPVELTMATRKEITKRVQRFIMTGQVLGASA